MGCTKSDETLVCGFFTLAHLVRCVDEGTDLGIGLLCEMNVMFISQCVMTAEA